VLTQFVRFAYVMAWHVAPVMSAQKSGLIVGISSAGGVKYFADVAYCAGKAAFDKMHHDMACELREHVRWGFPISRHCLMPCLECSDASLTTTQPFPIPLSDCFADCAQHKCTVEARIPPSCLLTQVTVPTDLFVFQKQNTSTKPCGACVGAPGCPASRF
jgi:hypothetical protein